MIDWVVKKLKPIIYWMGKHHLPFTHKKVTGVQYYLWRNTIEPGDVILSKTYGEFSNLINWGEMKHAAIYVGGGTVKNVVESIGRGTIKTDLVTHLTTKDEVVVLRPKKLGLTSIEAAIHKASSLLGHNYDYSFSFLNKELYCAELVYECYEEYLDLGVSYILDTAFVKPDHFLYDDINFEKIIDSRKG